MRHLIWVYTVHSGLTVRLFNVPVNTTSLNMLHLNISRLYFKHLRKWYCIHSKNRDVLTPYLIFPKIWTSPKILPVVSKNCWMTGKQYKPWSDAAFCGITLFTVACLSQYLGLLWYQILHSNRLHGRQVQAYIQWKKKSLILSSTIITLGIGTDRPDQTV